MSELEIYKALCKQSPAIICRLVDMYNAGGLSAKTRFVLEAIDGLEGPGDNIIPQTTN